jgi:Uma2 family endonuclease
MATATLPTLIGPSDHGRRMSLAAFIRADFEEGWLYELARGVVDVTEVPGIPHARIVQRLNRLFVQYELRHPGVIDLQAGGGECRIRTPGFQSDRHPDQAIYLTPPPAAGPNIWTRWIPDLVVEVVSKGGEKRDYEEKAEEYLRAGVREYWVVDPFQRRVLIHQRVGDTWARKSVAEPAGFRTGLLPGLTVNVGALLGPPGKRGR